MDSFLALLTGSESFFGQEMAKIADESAKTKRAHFASLRYLQIFIVFVIPLFDFTSDFVMISTVVIPSIRSVRLCATGDKNFKYGTWSWDGDDCGKVNRFTFDDTAGCTSAQRKAPAGGENYDYTKHHPGFVNEATSPNTACSGGGTTVDNTDTDPIGGIVCDEVPTTVTRVQVTSCSEKSTYDDCVKSYLTDAISSVNYGCMWAGTPDGGACTRNADFVWDTQPGFDNASCNAIYREYNSGFDACERFSEIEDCDSDQFIKCKTAYTFGGGMLPKKQNYEAYMDPQFPAPVFDDDGYPTNLQQMCSQCASCSDIVTYECGTRNLLCCMCQWPIATGETCCAQEGYKHLASLQCGGPGTCGKQVLVLNKAAPFAAKEHYNGYIWEKPCDADTVTGIDLTDQATCESDMPAGYGYTVNCTWSSADGECVMAAGSSGYDWFTPADLANIEAAALRRGQGFENGWCGFRDYHQWDREYWESNAYCEPGNGSFPIVYEHYFTGALGTTENKCKNVFTTFGVDIYYDYLVVGKYATNAAGIPLSCTNHDDNTCADCGIFPFVTANQRYADATGAPLHPYMTFTLIVLFCVVVAKEVVAPVLVAVAFGQMAEGSFAKFKEINFMPLASDSVVGFITMIVLNVVGYRSSYTRRMLTGRAVGEHEALVPLSKMWWYRFVWVPVDLIEVFSGVVFAALWLWNVNEYIYEIPTGMETNVILVSWVLSMLDVWIYRIPSGMTLAYLILRSKIARNDRSKSAKVGPERVLEDDVEKRLPVSLPAQTLDDIDDVTSENDKDKKKTFGEKKPSATTTRPAAQATSTTVSEDSRKGGAATKEKQAPTSICVRIVNAFLLAGYIVGFLMCSYVYIQTYLDRLDQCTSMDDGVTGMLTDYERTLCLYCPENSDGRCPEWYYTA